jgi:hypothetical protein
MGGDSLRRGQLARLRVVDMMSDLKKRIADAKESY